jgi:hypothetical protein
VSTHGFKTLLRWHWISSALCLIGMLGFAITGFTLNHAADIEAQPTLTRWQATLPAPVLAAVQAARPAREGGLAPCPWRCASGWPNRMGCAWPPAWP